MPFKKINAVTSSKNILQPTSLPDVPDNKVTVKVFTEPNNGTNESKVQNSVLEQRPIEHHFIENSEESYMPDECDVFEPASAFNFSTNTSSPSSNFKSQYAQSLADSYRRASLPVFVSTGQGGYYFNGDEFLSLNLPSQNRVDSSSSQIQNGESFPSQTVHKGGFVRPDHFGNGKQPYFTLFPEPASLPVTLDIIPEQRQSDHSMHNLVKLKLDIKDSTDESPDQKLWQKSGPVNNNIVRVADYVEKLNGQSISSSLTLPYKRRFSKVGQSDQQGVDAPWQLERSQLEHRVEQLCLAVSDRESTIHQLEEDLLRIRMECQRLMLENRSLKSCLKQANSPPDGGTNDDVLEVSQLMSQLELLTAKLGKAERSRHTYEAATRQLLDFLHTVNSTLGSTSHSPLPSFAVPIVPDLSPSISPSPSAPEKKLPKCGRHHGAKGKKEGNIRRADSVHSLPTAKISAAKVSRARSTHCLAQPKVNGVPMPEGRPTVHRSLALAQRARELLASFKGLRKNDKLSGSLRPATKSGGSIFYENIIIDDSAVVVCPPSGNDLEESTERKKNKESPDIDMKSCTGSTELLNDSPISLDVKDVDSGPGFSDRVFSGGRTDRGFATFASFASPVSTVGSLHRERMVTVWV